MRTDPNNRYVSPPPLVTHATRVMPVSAPKRRRNLVPLAAGLTTALSFGAGAFGMFIAVDLGLVDGPAPEACIEATEYGDELNVLAEEYSDIVGRAVEAAFSFDQSQVDAVEVEGEAFAVRYQDTLDAYEAAAAECRGETR